MKDADYCFKDESFTCQIKIKNRQKKSLFYTYNQSLTYVQNCIKLIACSSHHTDQLHLFLTLGTKVKGFSHLRVLSNEVNTLLDVLL